MILQQKLILTTTRTKIYANICKGDRGSLVINFEKTRKLYSACYIILVFVRNSGLISLIASPSLTIKRDDFTKKSDVKKKLIFLD